MSYTINQRRELLEDMLFRFDRNENTFPVFDEKGKIHIPILNQNDIVISTSIQNDLPRGFKGLVLEINDHGNVTVWKCFKNGNRREVASRV